MASAITFGELNFVGSPSPDDILAAKYIVALENKRRTEQNVILAAQTPPGTPIPLLLVDTGPNLKASYLSILVGIVTAAHASYITQARGVPGSELVFTDAQREQIRVNLITRLNNGESAASIIADTATL